MSEPTDIVVPATEEKPTEDTNVVETSPEVAVEPSAPVPVNIPLHLCYLVLSLTPASLRTCRKKMSRLQSLLSLR